MRSDVSVPRLGLAVVDEQHKFGVEQRLALLRKRQGGQGGDHFAPALISMSATPIPRSQALARFGDLKVSTLWQVPAGRLCVDTRVLPEGAEAQQQAYAKAQSELASGGRCYIVYPLISSGQGEEQATRAAEDEYENIVREGRCGPQARVGLLHGRMDPKSKAQAMRDFTDGSINVLVATSVVEVGVDVPEASVMIVHNAECFGFAQLHQLRGRVGRGSRASSCFLLASTEAALERLRIMEESSSGFEIAEADLRHRGPGEVLGSRQSGDGDRLGAELVELLGALPDVADADGILAKARAAAARLLADSTPGTLDRVPLSVKRLMAGMALAAWSDPSQDPGATD